MRWRAFNKAIKCSSEMALRKSGRPLFDRGASEHRGAFAVEKLSPLTLFPLQRISGLKPNECWIKSASVKNNDDLFQQDLYSYFNWEKRLIEALSIVKGKNNTEVGSGNKKTLPPNYQLSLNSSPPCPLGQEKLQMEHWEEKEHGGK